MVTKKKRASEASVKGSKLRVNKLKINKETVKNLTSKEVKKIRGGAADLIVRATRKPC